MEEKKFDYNSLIGMILLGAIMLWYFNTNAPEITPESTTTSVEKVSKKNAPKKEVFPTNTASFSNDSIKEIEFKNKLGAFAMSAMQAQEGTTILENELVKLTIDNKGGQIKEVLLKKFRRYDSLPLYLIKDNNASFNINFGTTDNRILNTKDLFFKPNFSKNGKNQVLTLRSKVSETQFLEYRYEMKSNEYMIDFSIRSTGLSGVFNTSNPINLSWNLNAYRNEKSIKTENTMYTEFYYKAEGDVDYFKVDTEDNVNDVDWVAYKQQFFTSNLLTDTPFNKAKLSTTDLVKDEKIDTVFTKRFQLVTPLSLTSGELNYHMKWFYGPSDYNLLKEYENTDLAEISDLGWGIFGFLNRVVFYPVFNFLKGFLSNFGLIIILMTIVVRIIMSPLVYKSYLSSAKMKVIRPELNALLEKYPGKENAMKRQQETMAIQRKAGVSMLSGCIPALLQMPVFFALFKFFPTNISLRQEGFLWAPDLSSYDTIFTLPFSIPFYGDHVSLFPILASVAIFFYMQMNQSQQANMQMPPQEGMPDMAKMMKIMIYLSPIMMLFFFNNYASSLSLYYFVSNLLTIFIMLFIKHFVIDEAKIHAQIEENKKKPVKVSKFRQRIDEAMKQAQEQQAKQQKKK
ncbi:membrane protein insertase YidC [Polaribacter sp. BAL334]|uniref:membrane protein insertase YidC n=1 Tax=Polaribacter sp. BAL334 TaxID=1708178 RepID=UPI0018D23329|nr:membrane protein insertase YidC [Polaribacter sp. BAL334]MBG7613046.1 membrane protein insertase YidC [Polaribacter sp. BAL334]